MFIVCYKGVMIQTSGSDEINSSATRAVIHSERLVSPCLLVQNAVKSPEMGSPPPPSALPPLRFSHFT